MIAVAAGTGIFAVPALAQPAARPAPAGATTHVAGGSTAAARAASSARIARYWTRSRMLAAVNAGTVAGRPRSAVPAARPSPGGPATRVGAVAPAQHLAGASPAIRTPGGTVARPLTGASGTPWTGNASLPPASTSGRVFFTITSNGTSFNRACSGSAVNSSGKDVVITAGHCVFGSEGGEFPGASWATNWEFVPGYNNGNAPFGVWTAASLTTLNSYISDQGFDNEGNDIGAADVSTNSAGQHLVNVVGGEGFAYNFPMSEAVADFGYPAGSPFNGSVLEECTGTEATFNVGISSVIGIDSNFNGGSSGGPWLMSFGGEFGNVNAVNAFTNSGFPGVMFSPYFGTNAGNVYNAVAAG